LQIAHTLWARGKCGEDVVKDVRQAMRNVVGEKTHDEVAVLLEQIVLSPVAAIVFGVLEVKHPVDYPIPTLPPYTISKRGQS